jgi:hypothetical protein
MVKQSVRNITPIKTKAESSPSVDRCMSARGESPSPVRKAHGAAVEKSGIKEHFRLYDLRRTFATRAVGAGVDLPNPFRNSETHEHSDHNALRASCRGRERFAAGKVETFRFAGMVEAMEKRRQATTICSSSAMRTMRTNVHNLLKDLVGAPGFEPGASCAQGRRATRLRYAPT